MKKIIIIIDGVADIPPKTSLSLAHTPTLDYFAQNSLCGLMHPIKNIAPESGEAQFVILGQKLKDFPGRGPLEALGSKIKLEKNTVYMRVNFGEIKNKKLISRRASRPIRSQIRKINKIHKDIKLKPTVGHRGILIIKNASSNITNSDPGYKKIRNYSQAIPIIMKELPIKGHKPTAKKLNFFIKQAKLILKTKTLLLRGAGKKPKKFKQLKNWSIIADMPVEFGLAKLLGMKKLKRKKDEIKQIMKSKHNIYVQIKAPDMYGHFGQLKKKIAEIEKIDHLLKPLTKSHAIICITADHATPYQLKRHSKHPVPFLIYGKHPNHIHKFTESACTKGKIIQGKDLLKLL